MDKKRRKTIFEAPKAIQNLQPPSQKVTFNNSCANYNPQFEANDLESITEESNKTYNDNEKSLMDILLSFDEDQILELHRILKSIILDILIILGSKDKKFQTDKNNKIRNELDIFEALESIKEDLKEREVKLSKNSSKESLVSKSQFTNSAKNIPRVKQNIGKSIKRKSVVQDKKNPLINSLQQLHNPNTVSSCDSSSLTSFQQNMNSASGSEQVPLFSKFQKQIKINNKKVGTNESLQDFFNEEINQQVEDSENIENEEKELIYQAQESSSTSSSPISKISDNENNKIEV